MPQDGASTNRTIFVGVVTHPQPAAGEYIYKANPCLPQRGRKGTSSPLGLHEGCGRGYKQSALHASGFKAYHYARLPQLDAVL